MKKESKPIEEMTYEQAFAELENIVSLMESGEPSLDEAIGHFERGQLLTNRCIELLDTAELKVRKLAGDKLDSLEANE